MENNYEICIPTSDEAELLDGKLIEEIQKVKPFTLNQAFVPINICAKQNGEIVSGVLAYAVMWDILYIDTVWTREDCRKKGLASRLIKEVEKRALELGCKIVRLSTYDFQAPLFYKKLGYTKFGEIDYGHTKEHFYYKRIMEEL
ncbi:MAG: GNAT family N-acetyltransferase [Clostridia bacterium]|nr:GNAT family N-acetyltransferase [Clostridia bacterium]